MLSTHLEAVAEATAGIIEDLIESGQDVGHAANQAADLVAQAATMIRDLAIVTPRDDNGFITPDAPVTSAGPASDVHPALGDPTPAVDASIDPLVASARVNGMGLPAELDVAPPAPAAAVPAPALDPATGLPVDDEDTGTVSPEVADARLDARGGI